MRRKLTSAFIVAFLAVHVQAAVRGVEDFPLTSALMFARDIGPDRPLYRFAWRVTDSRGDVREVNLKRLRLASRSFFLQSFLPALPDSPYHGRSRPADDPIAFEVRMKRWFGVLARRFALKTGLEPVSIDLLLRPYPEAGGDLTLGTFTVTDGRYRSSFMKASDQP